MQNKAFVHFRIYAFIVIDVHTSKLGNTNSARYVSRKHVTTAKL